MYLYITTVWPQREASAAAHRSLQVLDFLQKRYGRGLVLSPSDDHKTRDQFCALGFEGYYTKLNDSSILDVIRTWLKNVQHTHGSTLDFKVVVYDRFLMEEQFGHWIREVIPKIIEIIDLQDLHSLRRMRGLGFQDFWNLRGLNEKSKDDCLREVASILRVDMAWSVSREEVAILKRNPLQLLLNHVYVWPMDMFSGAKMRVHAEGALESSKKDLKKAAFFGNFRHEPNLKAALLLLREVWPAIQVRIPEARLKLFGAYAPEVLVQEIERAKKKGLQIDFLGWEKSVSHALRDVRILLSPLEFGAGVKGKVLESLAHGVCVAGTHDAWEGITSRPEELVEEEGCFSIATIHWKQALVDFAVRVLSDPTYFESVLQKQLKVVEDSHGAHAVHLALQKIEEGLRRLESGVPLSVEPQTDWLRSILRHESNGRSKYFGRWLELKERIGL